MVKIKRRLHNIKRSIKIRIVFVKANKSTKNTNKNRVLKILGSLITLFIAPFITAYFADCFIRKSLNTASEQKMLKSQLTTLENIYIGCSKEWIDTNLGVPNFSYIKYVPEEKHVINNEFDEKYLCGVYVIDFAVLRVFYDEEDLSCKAFFITMTDDDMYINIPRAYRHLVNDKSLGDFSYYDIAFTPNQISGFVSNGVTRCFYAETYYFYTAGNILNFHFATIDYGINAVYDGSFTKEEIVWDDELQSYDIPVNGFITIKDRQNNYPNTFGLSERYMSNDVSFELMSDYNGFDSFQLKPGLFNLPLRELPSEMN